MANVDRPNGAAPVRHINGSAWNGQVEQFSTLTTDSTAIFVGDFVLMSGTGDANGVPCVTKATATNAAVSGVVVGFKPDVTNLNSPSQYRLASTARTVYVCTDPTVLYDMQADGTTANAVAAIGLNAPIVQGSGSTVTGVSGVELNIDGATTTNTMPLKIVGAVQSPENDLTQTTFVRYLVMINNSTYGNNTAGV